MLSLIFYAMKYFSCEIKDLFGSGFYVVSESVDVLGDAIRRKEEKYNRNNNYGWQDRGKEDYLKSDSFCYYYKLWGKGRWNCQDTGLSTMWRAVCKGRWFCVAQKGKTQQAWQGSVWMICGVSTSDVDWRTSANDGASVVASCLESIKNYGLTTLENNSAERF